MAIWKNTTSVENLNSHMPGTLGEALGIEVTEIGEDFLCARMPVDHRTHQPYGLLHGGASVALAETLGSIGSGLCIDMNRKICVGMEINANHVRPVRSGYVSAKARPLHLGASTHIWEIRIVDEKDKLVCISRLTVAVLDKKDA